MLSLDYYNAHLKQYNLLVLDNYVGNSFSLYCATNNKIISSLPKIRLLLFNQTEVFNKWLYSYFPVVGTEASKWASWDADGREV